MQITSVRRPMPIKVAATAKAPDAKASVSTVKPAQQTPAAIEPQGKIAKRTTIVGVSMGALYGGVFGVVMGGISAVMSGVALPFVAYSLGGIALGAIAGGILGVAGGGLVEVLGKGFSWVGKKISGKN